MVLGLGIDIVQVERMYTWLHNERLLMRYFVHDEVRLLPSNEQKALLSLAGMFAAKEAFIKAITTPVKLKDIIIEKAEQGNPCLRLKGKALQLLTQISATNTNVSIAHETAYATAVVIVER